MINKLKYHNFKAFKDLDIELAPITLLLGPNNSGKSSILSGFTNWCRAGTTGHQDIYSKSTKNK